MSQGADWLHRGLTPSLSNKKQKVIFQRWHKQKLSRTQGGLEKFATTQTSSELFGFQNGKRNYIAKTQWAWLDSSGFLNLKS